MNQPDDNVAAAVADDGSGNGNHSNLPNFLEDPVTFLTFIANRPASPTLWNLLGGHVAKSIAASLQQQQQQQQQQQHQELALSFLYAVAQQLAASEEPATFSPAATATTAGAAAVSASVAAVASRQANRNNINNSNNNSNNNNQANMEAEMMRFQHLADILETVGIAAIECTAPRHVLSQTGILRALWLHSYFRSPYLNHVQVEFVQVALLSGQYRFAARALEGHWPRPASATAVSVRHVLRYYLLRGKIHAGCNDYTVAVRCFWTCLNVPSDICSALAINAWKQLVLIQCLQMEDDDYTPMLPSSSRDSNSMGGRGGDKSGGMLMTSGFSMMPIGGVIGGGNNAAIRSHGPLSLPRAVPTCISRFLNAATTSSSKQQSSQQRDTARMQLQQEPEDVMHQVQEELGEPSAEQQQQVVDNQQQRHNHSYTAMGVRVYMDLVHAFIAGDRKQFQSLQQEHAAFLSQDGNMGLVRQCETAMFQRQVYQLSRRFAVIPLTTLASKLEIESVDKANTLLQQLALQKTCDSPSSGSNNNNKKYTQWPSIDIEDDGMVVFHFASTMTVDENISGMVGDKTDEELTDNIQELIQLTKQVENLDVNIATSPMYHALARCAQDARMGGPRGVDEM